MTSHTLTQPSLRSMLAGLITHLTCFGLPEPVSVGWFYADRRFNIQISNSSHTKDLLVWASSLHKPAARMRRMPGEQIHLIVSGRLFDGVEVQLYTQAPDRLTTQYAAALAEHGDIPVTLTELQANPS